MATKQNRSRRKRSPRASSAANELLIAIADLRASVDALNRTLHTALEAVESRRSGSDGLGVTTDRWFATEKRLDLAATVVAGISLKDRFPVGVWLSSDAQQRWHLDFNDNGCEWTERAANGTLLKRAVDLEKTSIGWKIQRTNDVEVLGFLGASATVVSEIAAKNPLPSFITLDIVDDKIQGQWNGLRWTLDAGGHLKTLEQPGSTPSTIKQYVLTKQGDDVQWFTVSKGQLTFDQEGQEGSSLFHSRWLHWPGGASGVTLGRGYDMGQRTSAAVRSDLAACGVATQLATAFAGGAGLTANAANDFVAQKRAVCGNLTAGQQRRLFEAVYQTLEDDTKRICNSSAVVEKFGKVDFTTLDSRIWAVVVDMRFRGDYTPSARDIMQKAVADNDLAAFKKAMSDKANWSNVPQARFEARVNALA